MLLSIGNLFPVSFRFVDKFYTQKIVCSAFQSAEKIFSRKLFCLELFLSAKKVSLYNPFFNAVFSEEKFFFVRLFRLGGVCFCGIRVCRAAPLFWGFAVCKENFFCARHLSLRRCFCLWRRYLFCLLQRGFFAASLFYCAVGCRKARFYSLRSAENRREIEPRFSFCRAARSFHAHFLSVSLSEARQGRYSFPPRRSALYPSLFFTR